MIPALSASPVEASIESLAPTGEAVAFATAGDGARRAIFVRGAAPGDRVRLAVDFATRPARGELLGFVAKGAQHAEPACHHAARCGGCDWMHLTHDSRLAAYATHVREALPAAWRASEVEIHAAPTPFEGRARARLHVRAERGPVRVGLYEAGTHTPIEVDACVALHPALERARTALGALFDGARGRGEVEIALGRTDDASRRPVLDVTWRGELAACVFARLEQATIAGALGGARVTLEGATRPATIGDPRPWMHGADGEPLELAPGGFGQASEQVNAILARRVDAYAAETGAARITELCAGAGNFSVLLARRSALTTVEADRAACAAARANLARRGLEARVVEGDAAAPRSGARPDLVVLDPPRAGARDVALRLAATPPPHVLYVACDTRTLARDLTILEGAGYALRAASAFEMFPHTSHVETLVFLTRKSRLA